MIVLFPVHINIDRGYYNRLPYDLRVDEAHQMGLCRPIGYKTYVTRHRMLNSINWEFCISMSRLNDSQLAKLKKKTTTTTTTVFLSHATVMEFIG